jgi:hypothetical protein
MRVPASVRSIVEEVVAGAVEGTVSDVIRGKPVAKELGILVAIRAGGNGTRCLERRCR